MKKLIPAIFACALCILFTLQIYGQSVITNPDQTRLIEKFIGTWQGKIGTDSVIIAEFKPYGKAMVEADYLVIKEKKMPFSLWNYSYSADDGRFKIFALNADGSCSTYLGWFASENVWKQEAVVNFSPENVILKGEFVFDSPSSFTATGYTLEGVKFIEVKYVKVK